MFSLLFRYNWQDRFISETLDGLLSELAPSKAATDPKALKRKISPQILQLPGVSGIGIPKGRLTVYLEVDSDEVRDKVRKVLDTVSPQSEVLFMVTGKFAKQERD